MNDQTESKESEPMDMRERLIRNYSGELKAMAEVLATPELLRQLAFRFEWKNHYLGGLHPDERDCMEFHMFVPAKVWRELWSRHKPEPTAEQLEAMSSFIGMLADQRVQMMKVAEDFGSAEKRLKDEQEKREREWADEHHA